MQAPDVNNCQIVSFVSYQMFQSSSHNLFRITKHVLWHISLITRIFLWQLRNWHSMDAPTYDSPRCRGYLCRQWLQWHGTWFESENINAASLMLSIFARSHTKNPRWCRWCHILWFDGIHCRWVVKYPWLGVKNYTLTTGTCGMMDKKYIPHRPKILLWCVH